MLSHEKVVSEVQAYDLALDNEALSVLALQQQQDRCITRRALDKILARGRRAENSTTAPIRLSKEEERSMMNKMSYGNLCRTYLKYMAQSADAKLKLRRKEIRKIIFRYREKAAEIVRKRPGKTLAEIRVSEAAEPWISKVKHYCQDNTAKFEKWCNNYVLMPIDDIKLLERNVRREARAANRDSHASAAISRTVERLRRRQKGRHWRR